MILDYFKFALDNIIHRKLRSWLTMIGIFIGIAAVVALISLGQGMRSSITEQMNSIGKDKIMVMPGGGMNSGATSAYTSRDTLNAHDISIISKTPGVKLVGGMYYKAFPVEYRKELKYVFLEGFPLGPERKIIDDIQSYEVVEGRNLKDGEKHKALMGYMLSHSNFFEKPLKIGDKITVNETEFEIVGGLASLGNPSDDTAFYMSNEDIWELMNVKDEYGMLIVQTDIGVDPEKVAEDIREHMRRDRNQKKDEEDFSIMTYADMMNMFNVILDVVMAVLIGIAAISLLVGGIGIMNTMYTAILERTREIGIMKAVGARNSDIMVMFMIESGMLGLAGGIIGMIIGMAISKSIEYIAIASGTNLLVITYSLPLLAGALAFSFTIGVISGTLPAIQASKMRTVDALRYE